MCESYLTSAPFFGPLVFCECSLNGCPALDAKGSPTHINTLDVALDTSKTPYQGKNIAYGGLIACAAHTTAFQQIAVSTVAL